MFKKFLLRLVAFFHMNKKCICEESADMGVYDFHDYTDSIEEFPDHFTLLTCKRCGKKFYI